ncbi:hypothetical protein FF38_01404 [Lucilia cuprina]|uniref:Lethal giant larvae homologue 2 domain-containing protein n=1 Tax=Lucilia cuprina TaxID=7375 RepID=A0A0L0BUB8_LUCCU|nr:hypothetical protein FF38_01404 [Lucilia cuprina]
MKKFTFKGVLDGFRQTVQPQAIRQEQEIQESLKTEHFSARKTFRHGFPYSPTAFAFDPVQKLLAIGDKNGSLRILGRPGVDAHVKHEGESECPVILAEFIVNDGKLVTVTADDTIHLWNLRQKVPLVIQSLKFQRERVTCIHLPVASKWLYVGTEKGNIHVVNVETFALSGYVINWNKAIEVVRASHPGAVIALCDNPLDANKLLIAFECGLLVLWDLKGKFAEMRWQSAEPVKSIAWHYEGKYFVSSHKDGSICSWPTRPTPKPQSLVFPHAKTSKDGTLEKCNSIYKVDLKASQSGETFTIFSGGMPTEKGAKSNCITVMVGKTTTVLEMEHAVVDFITLCENPWTSETQEPYAIAVLLQYDLVLIDLLTPGFPCFESPYPMDLHESPVTCCTYLTDCPSDLVPAFYSVGRTTTSKKTGFSEREWPISGGEWSPASCSYSEIVITGHQDGSLKFWDSGAGTLQILYKLKTAKIFEKSKNLQSETTGMDHPLAIQLIYLCSESRRLCVAGSMGQVLLFKFRKVESTSDVLVLEIPILFENYEDIYGTSPECDFIPHQVQKTESSESDKTDNLLRVKAGAQRKPPGFQSQLVCLTTGPNRRIVQVTSLCINSNYGLMAYGTEYGLVIIDIIQKVCLLSVACPDLYGAHDPYSRTPKSPKRIENKDEQSRSPSSDQLNDTTSPDSPSIEYIAEANETLSSNQSHSLDQSNSSRPVSPDNEKGAVGGIGTKSPMRDEVSVPPKELPERRMSMSWKKNLKRQLSKVNMKIGKNMNNESDTAPKSSSVFYTQKECSPEDGEQSPPKDPVVLGVEVRESMTESNIADAIDAQAESGLSSEEKETSVTPEYLFETVQLASKRVDFANDTANQSPRPNNLPLTSTVAGTDTVNPNDAVPPTRPPRQKFKEKRDQRLLSVPNIKYQMRDMRTRPNRNDSSPSMGVGAVGGVVGGGVVAKKTQSLDSFNYQMINGSTTAPVASACSSGGNKVVVSGSPNNHLRSEANSLSTDEYFSGAGASSSGGSGVGNVSGSAGTGSGANVGKVSFTEQASTSSISFDNAADAQAAGIYIDKVDGSFSRSRSSSMSSIDMSSAESVTCLAFIETFAKRSDILSLVPTLWIGTSFGSILTLVVSMPEREVRKSQPVLVTINGMYCSNI